jgi:hypothetical protein
MSQKPRRKGDALLVESLAGGHTVAQAARQAGVSARTVFRRLGNPEFQERVRKARARMFDSATGALASIMHKSVAALRELLGNPSASIRLSAARCVLEAAQRLREAVELEQRLAEVESVVRGIRHEP